MKKILSFIVAAALVSSMAVTAFADKAVLVSKTDDTGIVAGTATEPIAADETIEFTLGYSANPDAGKDLASRSDVSVSFDKKGPIEIYDVRVNVKDAANGNIFVTFKADTLNPGATGDKDATIKATLKFSSDARRNGYENSEKAVVAEFAVGYETDAVLDAIYEAVDAMNDADDDECDVDMNSPVITSDAIKFLKNELGSKDVIHFNYKDITVSFTGRQIAALPNQSFTINYNTDDITAVVDALADETIETEFLSFAAVKDYEGTIKVDTDFDPAYVYAYVDGELVAIDATNDYGTLEFAGTLGQYVITDVEIPEDLLAVAPSDEEPAIDEEPADEEPTDEEPADETPDAETPADQEPNPESGANDVVNVAVALAVVSLGAAGAVAFKKAGK